MGHFLSQSQLPCFLSGLSHREDHQPHPNQGEAAQLGGGNLLPEYKNAHEQRGGGRKMDLKRRYRYCNFAFRRILLS